MGVEFRGLSIQTQGELGQGSFNDTEFRGLSIQSDVPFDAPYFEFYVDSEFRGLSIQSDPPLMFREKGEAISCRFNLIQNNPNPEIPNLNLPSSANQDCCFAPCVFASFDTTDSFQNDKTNFYWFYDNAFTNVTLELERHDNGSFVKVSDLNDNSLGTPMLFGSTMVSDREQIVGYFVNWNLVLNAFGVGTYRIKTNETSIFGENSRFTRNYCLKIFSPEIANFTVKIEWDNTGIIKALDSGMRTLDFGNNTVPNEIRLEDARFGFDSSTYEREFTMYQTNQEVWTKDIETLNYKLITGRYDQQLHNFLKDFMFKGDNIRFTDYNANNFFTHIGTKVIPNSEYTVSYSDNSLLARVELEFENEFKVERERC